MGKCSLFFKDLQSIKGVKETVVHIFNGEYYTVMRIFMQPFIEKIMETEVED